MKVVHINTSSFGGGAAIAAYRHVEAMSKIGFDAKLLTKVGQNQQLVTVLGSHWTDRCFEYALYKSTELLRKPYHAWSFMVKNYGLNNHPLIKEADVVYLHWINNFLGFDDVDQLLRTKKRIVWYMHDMWPMTGGCHHAISCKNYLKDCKNCLQLLHGSWIASCQMKKKLKYWRNAKNLLVATPSKWLADKAKESAIFGEHDIIVCPNVVDANLYQPANRREAKLRIGLNAEKKYILFGAAVDTKDVYKGMNYLYDALRMLDIDCEFLSMGRLDKNYPEELNSRTHRMGYITDEQQKVSIYQATDVFVIPSIAENFPNMVIEAMACGVPAVGFRVGGVVEQIMHKQRGYLCEEISAQSLAEGLKWALNNTTFTIARNCRDYVLRYCSYDVVLKNHAKLLDYNASDIMEK